MSSKKRQSASSPKASPVSNKLKKEEEAPAAAAPAAAVDEGAHLSTLCLHAGEKAPAGSDEKHVLHSHTFPIFQTSTFLFDDSSMGAALFAKQREGFIYSRIGNPTVEKFESVIAELEKGVACVAFGSGMAAVTAATLPFLSAGDHMVCSRVMYGPSVHVFVCATHITHHSTCQPP